MERKFGKALIFLNGDEENLSYAGEYIDGQTLLVGCDGGTDRIIESGLKPHAVIGDFDSIKNLPKQIKTLASSQYGKEILISGTVYIKYPGDKDFLDSEAAIDFAVRQNSGEIILVNTIGNQLDHILGTVILLSKPKYRNLNIQIITPTQKMYIARDTTVFFGKKGDKISLIPLYEPVKVESSSGLKYDPSKYNMSLQDNLGISNELTNKKAALHISKGRFLVVQHY